MKKIRLFEANDEMSKLANIFIAVSIVFIIFYLITVFVTNRPKAKVPEIVNIQYEEILGGSIFNKNEESYYVLAYEKTNINNDMYQYFLSAYRGDVTSLKVYIVDLSNIFNKPFIKENSSFDEENISFKEDTLLKVSKGKVIETFEGRDNIVSQFEKLTEKKDS